MCSFHCHHRPEHVGARELSSTDREAAPQRYEILQVLRVYLYTHSSSYDSAPDLIFWFMESFTHTCIMYLFSKYLLFVSLLSIYLPIYLSSSVIDIQGDLELYTSLKLYHMCLFHRSRGYIYNVI